MWSLFRYFDDEVRVTILDIGASLSESPDYQHLINVNRARLMAFEPDEGERASLAIAYGEPHLFFPHFVGDGRPATFHETNWAQTGSLFRPRTQLLQQFRNLASVITPVAEHPVQTVRLDDIPEITDVDLFKIDVQGSELAVFSNGLRVLADALVVQVEVNFLEQYEGEPMFADIDAFLRHQGFQYHTIKGHGYRPFAPLHNPRHPHGAFHQQIWADAIYVRDWMHLGRLAEHKLERYAVLLHDVVGSFDLAHRVLRELDRRRGGRLADEYARRLVADGLAVIEEDDAEVGAGGAAESASVVPEPWLLELASGLRISVPPSLRCISSYVLLEQERWFEKEMDFVGRCLGPGMLAIDIGANIGTYTLQMARAVGATGRVFAYEPGSDNQRHLQSSLALNGMEQVVPTQDALSSEEKAGWLRLGGSGELHMLVDADDGAGPVERVRVTTLDTEMAARDWARADFVKIDAEGQEARIVVGGQKFFTRFSPLVMFEIKHGSRHNDALRWQFAMLGYAAYRLTGDGRTLLPVGVDEMLDDMELNLFVAKPDRADRLRAAGLLAVPPAEDALSAIERGAALSAMLGQPFARSLEIDRASVEACPYGEALVDYAAYRYLDGLDLDRRCAALGRAFAGIDAYCAEHDSPPAWSTLARCAADFGMRRAAVAALVRLTEETGDTAIDQPFFPAAGRFDATECPADPAHWFFAAGIEQRALLASYSSYYSEEFGWLKWLAESGFASAEILRRVLLVGYRQGLPRRVMEAHLARLGEMQARNPDFWASGLPSLMDRFGS